MPATQPPKGPARAALRQRTMQAAPVDPPVHVVFAGSSVQGRDGSLVHHESQERLRIRTSDECKIGCLCVAA
jgi:hypothetical protein